MSTLSTGLQRLLQLAEHLEHGKLGHKKFDFAQHNNGDSGSCGTAGCALGECPILWPDEWKFGAIGSPVLKKLDYSILLSSTEFFGINYDEDDHLFYPTCQSPSEYGGKELSEKATKDEVAANIRAFVAIKAKEGQANA